MDMLSRIKRLVFQGRVRYTDKAIDEMADDGLSPGDVEESILNAQKIDKTLRSQNPHRSASREKLYVIKSFSFTGTLIYTKGKIDRQGRKEVFYVLISSKVATVGD